ncbi:MAG: ankyrin repeat domain-containing protein [Wolbachia endosymbiont of Fragariocoptes setiger]|nr:ankyrin repeat domain-containing protein [Wolbachia endosymbiont of Fragariocoptes setiger]
MYSNKLGETPLTYAKKLGNEEIEHYISDRISSTLKDEIDNSKVVIFKLVKFDNEQASITLKLNNESKSAFFPHGSRDVVINMPVNGLFINKDQALCARLPERFNESSLIWENLDDVFFVVNLSDYNTRSNLATGLYKMLNGHSNFSLNSYQHLPISNYVDYNEMYRILCTTLPKISLFERFNDSIHYLPHEIVRLIKNGVIDLEKDIDMYGETLLHHAVVQGNINLFNTLIEQSPSMVNAKDSNGLTPLNMAVHFNRTEMIERLKEVSIKYSKEESISMKKEEQIVEINSEK